MPRPDRFRLNQKREWYLFAAGLLILCGTLQIVITSDGLTRFSALQDLLRTGSIPDLKYSLIQPILTLPLAALVHMLSLDVVVAAAYFNLIVFLAFLLACHRPLVAVVGSRTAMIYLLIVTAASMFPHHVQWYFGEVLTALRVVVSNRTRIISPGCAASYLKKRALKSSRSVRRSGPDTMSSIGAPGGSVSTRPTTSSRRSPSSRSRQRTPIRQRPQPFSSISG